MNVGDKNAELYTTMSTVPKIFATGLTGYVGGDGLFCLLQKYPHWESSITALVRNAEKGALISAAYPKIKLVYGNLDDVELLEEESAEADIILNWADSDHPKSTEAIVRGAKRHTADKPVFLIHTSGTGILTWSTVESKTFGDLEGKIYDDWEGIGEVTSLPDGAAHRNVDKIILAAGEDPAVKTAIVCPPSIYGVGRGPGNKRSQQLYDLTRIILTSGKGMRVGKGENKQTHIHVYDLSDLYVLLIDEAVAGGGKATWGSEGYYFSSRGEQAWGEVARQITKCAFELGFISSDGVSEFTSEELAKSAGHSHAALIFGGNAREKTIRARTLLGYNPTRHSIFEEIPTAVASEAARLGITRKFSQGY
ncbi:hypothetical protein V490_05679 [Pseudogymnoascus sp. VKM F-3557]|nr:hypothetical protein V490_05679 [Pseudogymnoascus sp. VKM F-3557]